MRGHTAYQYFMWMQESYAPTILRIFAREGRNTWNLFFVVRNQRGEMYLHYPGPRQVARINAENGEFAEKMKKSENFVKLRIYSRRTKLPCIVIPKSLIVRQKRISVQSEVLKDTEFVDIEKYTKNINFVPFLLEPDRAYILDELRQELPKKSDVIIFTEVTPWIVVVVFE